MGSLIEMLASKKKAVVAPPEATDTTVLLPVLQTKTHEGSCGDACGCAGESDGGCCGG